MMSQQIVGTYSVGKVTLEEGIIFADSLQGMTESYELFRGLLLDHLRMQSGSPSSRGSGNGRRPAVPQLLLLLLLGAVILLVVTVRRTTWSCIYPCEYHLHAGCWSVCNVSSHQVSCTQTSYGHVNRRTIFLLCMLLGPP